MQDKKNSYDIIVIGAGSAGLTAAVGASGIGAKVLLVEKHKIGGDCTHYGCVPSKALIHASKMYDNLQDALAYTHQVVRDIAQTETPEVLQEHGITTVSGEASFVGKYSIKVDDQIYSARKIIIATGSRARELPIKGLSKGDYLTNKTIFDVENMKSLAIIGGGPIGSELSMAFARLGVAVTLIESSDRILAREDTAAAEIVMKNMRSLGVTVLTGARTERVTVVNKQKTLEVLHQSSGKTEKVTVNEVLVAVGRQPNIENLGLDQAEVAYTERGILVNKRGRTTNKHIYAIGDVSGPPYFTHLSNHQAKVALTHAIFKIPARQEERVIPRVTFTDPVVASVGLSEQQLRESGEEFIALKKPLSEMDRAYTDDNKTGFYKILVDKKGRILGATLVGTAAGELINEIALAMRHNIKITALADTIHPYPTYGYGLRQVADLFRTQSYTPSKKKWAKRLLRLRGKS